MQLAPGDVFAGYRIIRQIGSGGMGSVFLVDHPRLPRHDALKLLNRELSAEPDFVARFMREADIVSSLSHRNIVSIYDRGEEAGQLWLTMRYVDGIDAEDALAQAGGLLPAPRAVHVVGQVAAALDAAHRRNLIHRDVKPANILLSSSDDDELEQALPHRLRHREVARRQLPPHPHRAGRRHLRLRLAGTDRGPTARSALGRLLARLRALQAAHRERAVPRRDDAGAGRGPPQPAAAAGHRAGAVAGAGPGRRDRAGHVQGPGRPVPHVPGTRGRRRGRGGRLPPPPAPPYRVFLSRSGNGSGAGALLGPMRTEGMTEQASAHLVDLVRRTRFFDLPEQLVATTPPDHRHVTLEISTSGVTHRVVADLDAARRPPDLDDLVATVEQMPTAVPATARPPVPPTQRGPSSTSRFAQPPPPLPPATVPPPNTGERRASTATPVVERIGPPTPPPARTPTTPPPFQSPATPPPSLPPWSPSPEPAPRRGRAVLIAVLAAVVLGAGATTWFLLPDEDPADGGDSGAPTTSAPAPTTPPTTEATAAWLALPRTDAALDDQTLVAPREVEGNVDLYVIGADGTLGARLTTAAEDDVSPVISRDRRNIIYVREFPTGTQLRTVSVDGQGDAALFDPPLTGCGAPSRPAWNPSDPTQLALACYDGPTATLRVISLDGVPLHDLEPARPHIDDLAFSPDGRQLAYWGDDARDSRAGHVFVQPADGSAGADQVTMAGTDNGPAWSPDGTTLAFSRGVGEGAREIFTLDLEDPDAGTDVPARAPWTDPPTPRRPGHPTAGRSRSGATAAPRTRCGWSTPRVANRVS